VTFRVSSTQVVDNDRNIINIGYVQQDGGTPFWLNPKLVTTSFTIPSTHNAMSIGPITISAGITVTVSPGAVWTII
jgi:hypothetical protein